MDNNNNLIDDILKAIDIMATKKIASTGYDRTIQATIVRCEDRTIGKYKIKYQDGYWYAYSTSTDVYYSDGASVYILIPCGDMRKEKTILGAVQKLGTNYLNILTQEQKYAPIGDNIIIDNDSIFGLNSYKTETIVLYNKENSSSENLIQIDTQKMTQYLKQSPSIIIGGEIQTQLNIEQQYQGNYGILVGLDFLDNSTKTKVTRYYMVDVDMMTGNPYRFINSVHQSGIFEIDNQNFLDVNLIALFTKDFPNQDNSKPNDIFISNLEIKGAVKLSQSELDGYALLLKTPKGYIFNDQSLDTDIRRIEAEVRIKGQVINLKAQSLPFYWFIQNNSITSSSKEYNKYGGQGWKCLNNFNELNSNTYQFIPMSNVLQVKKSDVLIENVKYKCVTIYDNTVLSKEITIINRDAAYRIFIQSDQGTTFTYDIGNPTLICHCQRKNSFGDYQDVNINDYKFVWSRINNVGNFESLPSSAEYSTDKSKLKLILNKIQKELDIEYLLYQQQYNIDKVFPSPSDISNISSTDIRQEVQNIVNEFTAAGLTKISFNILLQKYNLDTSASIYYDLLYSLNEIVENFANSQTVENNKIIDLDIRSITRFATYKCAVFTKQSNNFLGTAAITLNNLLQGDNLYTLIINNGSQVFKYNTHGVSPASKQNSIPLEIPTLSFTVYDNLGNPVEDNVIKYSDITWTVPITNTLLQIDDSYEGDIDNTLSKKNYKGLMSLVYGISELYDASKNNNTIQLKVNYNEMTLVANTNLTFTKDGNSGTNGTDFVCRIVPNVISGGSTPVYPTLYFTDSTHFEFNWNTDLSSGHWFKAELWHNGNEPIFSGYEAAQSTEDKDVIIVGWEVLRNQYNINAYDNSNITILDGLTGRFGFTAGGWQNSLWTQGNQVPNWVPANIIKVTLRYDGMIYYATLPLIIVKKVNVNYKLDLKPHTGFREVVYTSAGIQPSYSNRAPFELIVQQKIGSQWEDITRKKSETYQVNYAWYYFGSIKERGGVSSSPAIIQQETTDENGASSNFWLMLDKKLDELEPCQKRIKPADEYDGECKNIGLGCKVYRGNATLAEIHIPIHMLRNRFENSAINGWDGNSVDLGDDNGGTILAPQIGAGYKDENNKFTGIVMGKSRDPKAIDPNDSQSAIEDKSGKKFVNEKEDIGLFGFHEGSRSIFLDARTGKAVFGEKDKAQIVLDPSQIKNGKPVAQIKSGDYNYNPGVTTGAEAGAGMMIDLSTPQIKYGTGNFEVNQNGHLTAKGGGSIANWQISNYKLTSGTTGISSQQDSNGEGAEIINFKSPFENLIPQIYDKWKKGGVSSYQNGDSMEEKWTQGPEEGEDWLTNEHYIIRTDETQKVLTIGDHNDSMYSDYLLYHKNSICVHIDSNLRDNQAGVIVYSYSAIPTTAYEIQLVILAYKPDNNDFNEYWYFSAPVSDFSKPGILINISKQILSQSGTGNKFSYLIQLIKKDGSTISLSDNIVEKFIENIRIFSSSHLSLANNIKTKAFWVKNSITNTESYLTHDGVLVSNSALFGDGINRIYIGKRENATGSNNDTALFSFKKYAKNVNSAGFYLGTDGLAIGNTYQDSDGNYISNFQVDINGKFYAKEGYIGNKTKGWNVKADKMYNGGSTFGSSGFFLSPTQGMSLVARGTSSGQLIPAYNEDLIPEEGSEKVWPDHDQQPLSNQKVLFSVDKNGVLTAKKAYIANWYMTNNQLRSQKGTSKKYPGLGSASYNNGTVTITAGGDTNPGNIAITSTGIRIGNSFYIKVGPGTNSGKVYCTNAYLSGTIYGTAGKIGGWTIGSGKLSASKIELNANNNIIAVGYGGKMTVGTNITLDGTEGSIKLGGGSYNTTFSSGGCYISANGFAGFNTTYIEDLRINAPHISGNLYHLGMNSDRVVIALDGSSIRFKDIDREYNSSQYSNFYNLKTYKAKYKKGFLVQGDIWQDKYLPMFVAEEVAELQPLAAKYDNNGQVQDWNYRVIIPIQHLLIRDLNNRVSTLQKQIKELKQLINK